MNLTGTLAQVRIARPTDRLADVERFYVEHIGLPVLHRFQNHAGYDGVMIGLPGIDHHLEFTSHVNGRPCPAPSRDNLLVLYFHDDAAMHDVADRLKAAGHDSVVPENPYWTTIGALTFEDPDRWRVVLAPQPVF
jgi:catechol 2,3-dioxygenase-like lactoylglutathione lyase family enzyme